MKFLFFRVRNEAHTQIKFPKDGEQALYMKHETSVDTSVTNEGKDQPLGIDQLKTGLKLISK